MVTRRGHAGGREIHTIETFATNRHGEGVIGDRRVGVHPTAVTGFAIVVLGGDDAAWRAGVQHLNAEQRHVDAKIVRVPHVAEQDSGGRFAQIFTDNPAAAAILEVFTRWA